MNRNSLAGLSAFGFASEAAQSWGARDTAALLAAVSRGASTSSLAAAAAVNRTTAARWLRGATEPSVPELLRCVDLLTHRLIEFTALFAEPSSLASTARLSANLEAQRRIAYEEPLSHAVLRALELAEYKALENHVPGFIATAIGVSAEEERALLTQLRKARLIQLRRRKWQPVRVLTVDTRVNPAADQQLKEYWAALGLARLRRAKPRREAYFSYNLCAVSRADSPVFASCTWNTTNARGVSCPNRDSQSAWCS